MSIHVALRHNMIYQYDRAIKVSPQTIRLKPAPHTRSPILAYSLKISPEDHFINWQQDPFGNYVARAVFPNEVKELRVEVEVIVDMITINPFDFFVEEYAEIFPWSYTDQLKKELLPYLEISESGPLLDQLYEESKQYLGDNTINFLVNANQLIYNKVGYTIRLEPGIQSCEQTLSIETGSCRDSAWLLVQLMRMHGMAARFASGYLVQLTPDQKSVDGPSGTEEDFTDLHAWAEVYIPGAGWIGLDATSGLLAGEGHIPLSCTPDPVSAAPITGFTDPCEVTFSYENLVERIYESPRVTKPYSDTQWSQIQSLAQEVDSRLALGDVRLTMGGEPTFVSAEDMESDQWNTKADGVMKRKKAYELTLRLKEKLASNALIHCGQGKWYPGEAIPRWQYTMYWRKDGQALWPKEEYLADPSSTGSLKLENLSSFTHALAKVMGLSNKNVHPAYEDFYYFLWEKAKLPVDIDLEDLKNDENIERQKLGEILQNGLEQVAGYVIPIRYGVTHDRWESCVWQSRRQKLFLIPGNSAMGYRLPLDTLEQADEDVVIPPSPLDDLGPLPGDDPTKVVSLSDVIFKTAICMEVRAGHIHVFLPPLNSMDEFIKLIANISAACEKADLPVIIEGYQGPHDYRVERMSITPDPGVIEVNVPPSKSWQETTLMYETLFEEARQCKLGAEKFMIDGRHTGTGGGNHITLGGITPSDSPLLRRPDLLRSMINFWQNHPSMSYLFSSAFVGPTSQAPRVDEGRKNTIDELEIAFAELDRHPNPTPWIVDRLFRNLLIDLTGNTHRAEFCIDKLYNPDSNSGRLGILELRGFDMPPSYEMCMIQLLLIRSLVVRFWEQPYQYPLIDWGRDLHDKYLLHHYVREDMKEVIHYLHQGGLPFEMEWLDTFFDFRFPLLGEANIQGIRLSFRAAIEPWYVLGEEMSSAGTARYVDSSVEKVEVLIQGLQPERYALLCNQVQIPLQSTQIEGTYVCGIRYKAWNPPSSLHPTVGVDTPLTFDIYDKWNNRSIGGCTYHVSHPGGRSYDTFPINTLEAEARRVTRFYAENHTPKNIVHKSMQSDGGTAKNITVYTDIQDIPPNEIIQPKSMSVYTTDLRRLPKVR